MDQGGAARVRQQLAAQADQAARRNFKIQSHATGAVIAHLQHFAAAAADGFHDDADEIFRNVDHQALDRLEFLAIFVAHHDFGLADHQFEALAAHGLDQNGELQFAAAEYAEGFRRVDAFADLDALNACDGDDIARNDGFGFIAIESAEGIELGDFGGGEFAVELADADFF